MRGFHRGDVRCDDVDLLASTAQGLGELGELIGSALGLDVGSGNTRRLAADLAMQTNRPVLTQRIRVIEGEREVPGFLLFLPLLIIDLVVASVLMSMGMIMLPPVVVSLPFKLIFFVLVDGWSLVAGSLVQSYGSG